MMWWRGLVGPFEKFARYPLTPLFFFIIFVIHLLIQTRIQNNWQGIVVVTSMTWVRVPGLRYFLYYFAIQIHVQAQ